MRLSTAALVLLAALSASSAASATAHCFCRLVKADAGDCNLNAVAVDAGAVAEFKELLPGKEKLCTDACDRVLQTKPLDELCAGLSQKLKVPLPWGGDLRTCTRVGARGDRAGARRRVDCAAGSSTPKGPDGWWRPTFADEFKGMPADATPEQRDCYTRKPSCIEIYASGSETCPANRWGYESVKHLDKCTWSILHRNNTWAPEWAAFDARQVTVRPDLDDGVLIIGMRATGPDGSYLPFQARKNRHGFDESLDAWKPRAKWKNKYDCGRGNNGPSRVSCPFATGGVISQDWSKIPGSPRGFIQRYGRFEVRAKLTSGVGGAGALWMVPQDGSWPGAGELDLMEQIPDGTDMFQTFHTGTCTADKKADLDPASCKARGGKRIHLMKGETTRKADYDYARSYHVFAVEWDRDRIRFLLDDKVTNEIAEGNLKQGSEIDGPKNAKREWMPMWMPDRPFHFILDSAVSAQGRKGLIGRLLPARDPNVDDFVPLEMRIDYVRAFAKCERSEDLCPRGGAFDGRGNCQQAAGVKPYPSPCVRKAYR